MILTVDAGNTTISFAGFEDGKLMFLRKMSTQHDLSPEESEKAVRTLLDLRCGGSSDHLRSDTKSGDTVQQILRPGETITAACGTDHETGTCKIQDGAGRVKWAEGAILSSVVPDLNDSLMEALERVTGKQVLLLTPALDTGISVADYAAGSLGMDRLADLAGAAELVKPPLIVFDLGTCTTASALDENRCFAGGMIAPGMQISLDAMHARTAKLPQLVAATPEALLGKDTPGCMMSGTVIGAACIIDGYADRVEQEIDKPLSVVVTGGAGELVIPWCRRDVRYEPQLLHHGLYAVYMKNTSKY